MRAPDFWYPQEGRLTRTGFFLAPIGWLYHLGGVIKRHTARPEHVDVPVLCLGNLTVGGTGKTPLCLALAPLLRDMGYEPHFLTRGYGGTEKGPTQVDPALHTANEVGDEPLLLASAAPTWVSADRPAGARAAVASGATLIVMDDGFQNPSLTKDLCFVVIDQARGLGNGQVIPAGPLREFARQGLARTDAILLTGPFGNRPAALAKLLRETDLPVFETSLRVEGTRPSLAGGANVVAFAGIGQPQKFFDTVAGEGFAIREAVPFPDHHPYSDKDLNWLRVLAEERQAALITTAKDAVRLPPGFRDAVHTIPVVASFDDDDALRSFLQDRLAKTA